MKDYYARRLRPYGVRRGDVGCCPGHDKYHRPSKSNKHRARQGHRTIVKKEEAAYALDHGAR